MKKSIKIYDHNNGKAVKAGVLRDFLGNMGDDADVYLSAEIAVDNHGDHIVRERLDSLTIFDSGYMVMSNI